jgi:hypothetical protein
VSDAQNGIISGAVGHISSGGVVDALHRMANPHAIGNHIKNGLGGKRRALRLAALIQV